MFIGQDNRVMNIRIGVDIHVNIFIIKKEGGGGGFFWKNERERDNGIESLPLTLMFYFYIFATHCRRPKKFQLCEIK